MIRYLHVAIGLGVIAAIAFVLGLNTANAQGPQQASPQVQALSQKLMQEISQGVQCRTDVIALQEQVKQLQAELAKAQKQDRLPAKKKP